jgi:hypothetical protein
MYILSNKMGGGLMQLVAYGAQDIYLTGNPQITFFKVVYRRHTNFSMEAIEQTWNGSSTTAGRCTATISRNGDLVSRMYIEVGGTVTVASDNMGVSWIKSVELEIGGQKIDKQSGVWMETWAELTQPNPTGFVGTVANNTVQATGCTLFQNTCGHGGIAGVVTQNVAYTVPLQFWFCRNPGLALPLIALQYHEVKVILDHNIGANFGGPASVMTNKLWADYIYLDTEERRRFAQVSHEYLIEQVQEQGLSATLSNDLNFNHPCKELIWTSVGAAGPVAGAVSSCSLVTALAAVSNTVTIKLNGHDRFAARAGTYFSRTQVLQHHSGYGGLASNGGGVTGGSNDAIGVYSFALKPEEHQPSGTCNFSRIDNAQFNTSVAVVGGSVMFAVNYNVLRVMSGMGGLAYSN